MATTRRKAKLLQDEATVREEPRSLAPVTNTYKRGHIVYLHETTAIDGALWVRITGDDGTEGFMSADTQIEEITQPRFRVERIVFILIFAGIAALVLQPEDDFPAIGVFAMSAFLVSFCYFMAGSFLGIEWAKFFEAVNEDALPAPAFDMGRFIIEPLSLLAAAVAVMIFAGMQMIFLWAFSGFK